ncbi:MAG: hypothetical protein EU539_01170 [Promethearchaeota archaeon]|nr:MAG: hypothetical protein EU539_01170 [Candidatus Lokiarchaeota archaeon]
MTNEDKLEQEETIQLFQKLNDRMNEFSSIFQKFGLDLITKLGQTNTQIKMLTDKIDKLDKTTLDIKALLPKLNTIVDNQNILESEIDLIKSLIQRSSLSPTENEVVSEPIDRDKSITKNKKIITAQFEDLLKNIEAAKDMALIKNDLQKIKEQIFELIGGHKVLYEISKAMNKLDDAKSLTDEVKDFLKEKIGFWMNKL